MVPRAFFHEAPEVAMADTVDPKFTDKRTAPRYVTSGQVEEKAWERHLKNLPDLTDKSLPIETVMADEDFDDEEDLDDEDEGDDEDDTEGDETAKEG